jgi:hypothetical protein
VFLSHQESSFLFPLSPSLAKQGTCKTGTNGTKVNHTHSSDVSLIYSSLLHMKRNQSHSVCNVRERRKLVRQEKISWMWGKRKLLKNGYRRYPLSLFPDQMPDSWVTHLLWFLDSLFEISSLSFLGKLLTGIASLVCSSHAEKTSCLLISCCLFQETARPKIYTFSSTEDTLSWNDGVIVTKNFFSSFHDRQIKTRHQASFPSTAVTKKTFDWRNDSSFLGDKKRQLSRHPNDLNEETKYCLFLLLLFLWSLYTLQQLQTTSNRTTTKSYPWKSLEALPATTTGILTWVKFRSLFHQKRVNERLTSRHLQPFPYCFHTKRDSSDPLLTWIESRNRLRNDW